MAITVVQKNKGFANSAVLVSVAYLSNTTAGNLLIVVAAAGDLAALAISGGGTWQQAAKQDDSLGGGASAQCGIAISTYTFMRYCEGHGCIDLQRASWKQRQATTPLD